MEYVLNQLKQLHFCRLKEVPRREERHNTSYSSTIDASLFAALVSAHAKGEPIAVGWFRTAKGGPVNVLVGGGTSLIASIENKQGDIRLLYPPGSRGKHLEWGDLQRTLFNLPFAWLRCGGTPDVFATTDKESP